MPAVGGKGEASMGFPEGPVPELLAGGGVEEPNAAAHNGDEVAAIGGIGDD